MSKRYRYARKKESEIEEIAAKIKLQFPRRWASKKLNIEGLVEDYGITVIARQRLGLDTVGYAPKDPNYIVVSEQAYQWLPNLRHTLSEELAHTILEFKLYKNGKLPKGAAVDELSDKKHKDVEDNADMLASALLLPKEEFLAEWYHQRGLLMTANASSWDFLKKTSNAVSDAFGVIHFTTARRARDLHLINHPEYKFLSEPVF